MTHLVLIFLPSSSSSMQDGETFPSLSLSLSLSQDEQHGILWRPWFLMIFFLHLFWWSVFVICIHPVSGEGVCERLRCVTSPWHTHTYTHTYWVFSFLPSNYYFFFLTCLLFIFIFVYLFHYLKENIAIPWETIKDNRKKKKKGTTSKRKRLERKKLTCTTYMNKCRYSVNEKL